LEGGNQIQQRHGLGFRQSSVFGQETVLAWHAPQEAYQARRRTCWDHESNRLAHLPQNVRNAPTVLRRKREDHPGANAALIACNAQAVTSDKRQAQSNVAALFVVKAGKKRKAA
jgi:hypothetical protein